jgi:hypothetical protein
VHSLFAELTDAEPACPSLAAWKQATGLNPDAVVVGVREGGKFCGCVATWDLFRVRTNIGRNHTEGVFVPSALSCVTVGASVAVWAVQASLCAG